PDFFFSYPSLIVPDRFAEDRDYWVNIRVRVPSIPVSGNLRINIHGVAELLSIKNRRRFGGFFPATGSWERQEVYYQTDTAPDLYFTGFFFGVAKGKGGTGGGENEILPADHNYVVFNDGEYTDRFE